MTCKECYAKLTTDDEFCSAGCRDKYQIRMIYNKFIKPKDIECTLQYLNSKGISYADMQKAETFNMIGGAK